MSLPMASRALCAEGGGCAYLGVKETDRVGKTSAHPDGKPDAVFSLDLAPEASTSPVSRIELRAAAPKGLWSTTMKPKGAAFLGVARAKIPSEIVNRSGGTLEINPSVDPNLLLFVSDDGEFAKKGRKYQVRVVYSDGKSWTAQVNQEPEAAPETASGGSGVYPVRMSAYLKGISNYDAVGADKQIRGDDKADGLFQLSVEAENRVISAIEIRNVDGMKSIWDTVPLSSNPPVGVALVSDPVRLLNKKDGSVRIEVKRRADLNLYVADNGSISGGKTNYRVTVSFADGGISWCPVQRAEAPVQGKTTETPPITERIKVNFLGTWLGFASTDAVGPYPEIKPDGKADAMFGLDIETAPPTTVTGIEISTLDGISKRWGTTGAPGMWGMGVVYKTSPRALVNKPDGSVRIPLDKRTQFLLYVADPGNLATSSESLRMIVYLSDGSSYQQFVRRPLGTTPTVVPGGEEPPAKAMGIITCEFRGFIADLVDTSTRPRKDGYFDGTFIMKLQVEDKKLAKVEISSGDGVVHWSSTPRTPQMFLGVALYPKIYKLIDTAGSALQIPISGRRTLYLYAADNGMLSDPKSRLITTVTFTDKTTLSAEVIK